MMQFQRQAAMVAIVRLSALFVLSLTITTTSNNINIQIKAVEASQLASTSGGLLSERLANIQLCATRLSCKTANQRPVPPPGDPKTQHPCYCDDKCSLYDDCCVDSQYSKSMTDRARLSVAARQQQEQQQQQMNGNGSMAVMSIEAREAQHKLLQAQQPWHCHRVNPIFGDVLVKANCIPGWHLLAGVAANEAKKIEMRCDNTNRLDQLSPDIQADPLGMMMPITDLKTGITYANTYCVRCNKFYIPKGNNHTNHGRRQRAPVLARSHPSDLIFWSPLVECNYNRETDDKNTLIDLITNNTKSVLEYSASRNRWIINVDHAAAATTTTSPGGVEMQTNGNETTQANTTIAPQVERTCTIVPSVPDSVDHLVRYCHSEAIHTCPPQPTARQPAFASRPSSSIVLEDVTIPIGDKQLARTECEFGHQALVMGFQSGLVYRNPGCAICNKETQLTCNLAHKPTVKPATRPATKPDNSGNPVYPYSYGDDDSGDQGGSLGRGSARTGGEGGQVSATLSVLFDFDGYYGSGDDQVGVKHFCPGKNQIWDVINRGCRCIYCGLNQRYVEGECIHMTQDEIETALILYGQHKGSGGSSNSSRALNLASGSSPANQIDDSPPDKPQLVNKFGPWMAYLTIVNLTISILCLSLYLMLYYLSMFNLNSLKVDLSNPSQVACMMQREKGCETPRRSRVSSEANSLSGASYCSSAASQPRSNSLSSRGVACLSTSLLAAYVLFLFGHNSVAPSTATLAPAMHKPSFSCFLIAVGTYYCFLVAFSWMFLLSYDIWRILRLATCELRGPAMHSQSTRFITYALFSLTVSGLLVGASIFIEKVPVLCDQSTYILEGRQQQAATSTSLAYNTVTTIAPSNNHHHNNHHRVQRHPGNNYNNNSSTSSTPPGVTATKASDFNYQNSNSSSSSGEDSGTPIAVSMGGSCPPMERQFDQLVELYKPNFGRRLGSCWFTNKRSLLVFFGVPVMLILIFNLIFFLHCSFMVIGTLKYDPNSHSLGSLVSSVVRDYRLYCRLTTIMGLTWITGILASFGQSEVLWYLFILLNTLQGLFIFVAFGCKRSKLANLKILLTYLYFRWLLLSGRLETKAGDTVSNTSSSGSFQRRHQLTPPAIDHPEKDINYLAPK